MDLEGKTFVLVHGAWHGGWCWRDVARALRLRGAEVYTPTLTGMGERQHLRSAYRGLQTFIDDVCGVIAHEELHDVVLVGHSFGGMVITGVADRMPAAIARLVYLDAAVPQAGESMATQSVQMPPEMRAATQAHMLEMGKLTPWMAPFALDALGLADAPAEVRERDARLMTDHPISSLTDPLVFVDAGSSAPATYIVCDAPPMPGSSFVAHYENVLAGRYGDRWTARRIATGHMAMLTAPDETVTALAEAALM